MKAIRVDEFVKVRRFTVTTGIIANRQDFHELKIQDVCIPTLDADPGHRSVIVKVTHSGITAVDGLYAKGLHQNVGEKGAEHGNSIGASDLTNIEVIVNRTRAETIYLRHRIR